MKMMLIGLGNHDGAKIYHRAFQDYTFGQIVESVGREVLARCPIVAGLAIVENGYEETAKIEAVLPADFLTREKALLVIARELLPRLPLERLDLLVVDEMGKNVSGTGMDTNVIGRKFNESEAVPDEFPKVRRIAVRGLTEATHGNALGIGMAEFCTRRLVDQIDFRALTINCLTSGRMACAKVPLAFDTDRQMIEAALSTVGLTEPPQSRILWIRNTRELLEMECSAVLLDEMQKRENVEVISACAIFRSTRRAICRPRAFTRRACWPVSVQQAAAQRPASRRSISRFGRAGRAFAAGVLLFRPRGDGGAALAAFALRIEFGAALAATALAELLDETAVGSSSHGRRSCARGRGGSILDLLGARGRRFGAERGTSSSGACQCNRPPRGQPPQMARGCQWHCPPIQPTNRRGAGRGPSPRSVCSRNWWSSSRSDSWRARRRASRAARNCFSLIARTRHSRQGA